MACVATTVSGLVARTLFRDTCRRCRDPQGRACRHAPTPRCRRTSAKAPAHRCWPTTISRYAPRGEWRPSRQRRALGAIAAPTAPPRSRRPSAPAGATGSRLSGRASAAAPALRRRARWADALEGCSCSRCRWRRRQEPAPFAADSSMVWMSDECQGHGATVQTSERSRPTHRSTPGVVSSVPDGHRPTPGRWRHDETGNVKLGMAGRNGNASGWVAARTVIGADPGNGRCPA